MVAGYRAPGLGHDRRRRDAALGAHIAQRAHHIVCVALRQAAAREMHEGVSGTPISVLSV